MNLAEYAQYDGLGLAELIRKKEVTTREIAVLFLQGVEKVNPKLNAVIEIYDDRVEEIADVVLPNALFAGVPFLRKDIGATEAGRLQELGSRLAKGYVAEKDAFLTSRFKEAGVMILGRTSTPEFGISCTTESVLCGATRNPWNPERMAGGSSGGAAASVAAGVLPVTHASDGGGSIRIPASCCGLVGLKPSRGRVSAGPNSDELLQGLAQELVVSRSVRDTAAMLDAVCAPGVGDPFVIAQPKRPYTEEVGAPTGRLRIAYTARPWSEYPVDPEVSRCVESIALKCETMGHEVVEASPAFDYDAFLKALFKLWIPHTKFGIEFFAAATGREVNEETLEPVTLAYYEHGRLLSPGDWFAAMGVLNGIRRRIGQFFQIYDLLLTPTLAQLPQPLGKYRLNNPDWTAEGYFVELKKQFHQYLPLFNATGQPAVSLPLGQSETGLPIGVQFVARFGEEAALIRIASAFQEAMPWSDRRPPIHVGRD